MVLQDVEVEPNINFEKLSNLTKGYSGDDLTNVCRDAAMNGMRRKIAGKTPDQIRSAIRTGLRDACFLIRWNPIDREECAQDSGMHAFAYDGIR